MKRGRVSGDRHGALDDDLSFLLARANALSIASANEALAGFGLKARQFAVLSVVADDARPSQKELAEILRLDPSQVVGLVDELEKRTLVRREPDPSDRRAKVIVITSDGIELFETARTAVFAAEQKLHAMLSPEERDQLADTLRRIAFED